MSSILNDERRILPSDIDHIFSLLGKQLCIHLNNSKNIKGANVDRHEYLFEGKIHPQLLKEFVKNFDNSIIIIEKPSEEYKKEINYIVNV
jgi:endonuclease IV